MRTFGAPGVVYAVELKTDGVPNPREVYDLLKSKLMEKFRIDVRGMTVENADIKLQFAAGLPFAWAALIEYLPLILRTIGIAITVITAYLALAKIPAWQWALMVLGIALTIFGETIVKLIGGKRVE